jgi:hypothetical protein
MTVKDYRADFVHAPFFRTSQHAERVSPALLSAAQALDENHARCSAGNRSKTLKSEGT